MFIDWVTCPPDVRDGLRVLMEDVPQPVNETEVSLSIHFVRVEDGKSDEQIVVTRTGDESVISYSRKIDAFRGFGKLLGELCSPQPFQSCMSIDEVDKIDPSSSKQFRLSESCLFDTLGVMIDVSRNAVLTVESVKTLLRRCALMGINMVMLYTEDVYEVPDEPFFGYLRGRYSSEELRTIDDYGYMLGIEMVPCIQTLGHLEQVLQWPNYSEYKDTEDVILANSEKTYNLLEKMIQSASKPFRSSRIHIGMDEAEGLGCGNYGTKFGEKKPFDIFTSHLSRVTAICNEMGLKPMIWSDMYFRLGSESGDYYDASSSIPEEVRTQFPKGVDLVYWDYYHTSDSFYENYIDKHREICDSSNLVVATGVWTWGRFWAALPFTFSTIGPCMEACKRKSVKQVITTIWGDDGNECDVFSALPGMQYFAEHGYNTEFDHSALRRAFMGCCCGENLDTWVQASKLDTPPPANTQSIANTSKWLMWEDIFLGHLDPQFGDESLKPYYSKLADDLKRACIPDVKVSSLHLKNRLRFPCHVARVLSLKVGLRSELVSAYAAHERDRLYSLLLEVENLKAEIDTLWKIHRNLWLEQYKAFGLEVLEGRYGAIRCRVESLHDRLDSFLKGEIDSIPEFEVPHHKIYNTNGLPYLTYGRVVTCSRHL